MRIEQDWKDEQGASDKIGNKDRGNRMADIKDERHDANPSDGYNELDENSYEKLAKEACRSCPNSIDRASDDEGDA